MTQQATATKWEHVWLSLQWHAGVMGMGKGWDKKMIEQIDELGRSGFEICSVVQQKDPTWFILFFKRPYS
jgi:hypothetical protein